MRFCRQASITDACFAHLRGVRELDMSFCWQESITGATFAQLSGVRVLRMAFCRSSVRAAAARAGLPVDGAEASIDDRDVLLQ